MSYLLKLNYQNYHDEEKTFSDKQAAKDEFERLKGESGLMGMGLYKVTHMRSWSYRDKS